MTSDREYRLKALAKAEQLDDGYARIELLEKQKQHVEDVVASSRQRLEAALAEVGAVLVLLEGLAEALT